MRDSPFDAFAKGFGLFGLGAPPPPPDSIPLRMLGLDAMPAERSAIVAAFRRSVRAAHPDSAIDDMGEDATVTELVWAREFLLAKLPRERKAEA